MRAGPQVWVITGASRGIGLALVVQALRDENVIVYACARHLSDSTALQDCKRRYDARLQFLELDLLDVKSVEAAANQLKTTEPRVDVLVNNAGVGEPLTIDNNHMDAQVFQDAFGTNVIGAHCMMKAFSSLMEGSDIKKIINISSIAGSVSTWAPTVQANDTPFQLMAPKQAAYKASKTALVSLTVSWASTLRPEAGYKIIALDPGVVSTEAAKNLFRNIGLDIEMLSSFTRIWTPDECAEKIFHTIEGLKKEDSGKFMTYDGTSVPF